MSKLQVVRYTLKLFISESFDPGKRERKQLGKRPGKVILASLIDCSSYSDQDPMIIDGFIDCKKRVFGPAMSQSYKRNSVSKQSKVSLQCETSI
jgi:hypothetical protein